jgi:hypothetical protein
MADKTLSNQTVREYFATWNWQRPVVYAVLAFVLLVLALTFAPFLWAPATIDAFYADSNNGLASNKDITQSDDFKRNHDSVLWKLDPLNPMYKVFYTSDKYLDLQQATLVDTVYLQRKNVLWWEVVDYRTNHISEADMAKAKQLASDGKLPEGLTRDQDKTLSDRPKPEPEPTLQSYTKNPSGTQTIEVQGYPYGENYLVRGTTGEKLGIENVYQILWLNDNEFVYSLKDYDLLPNNTKRFYEAVKIGRYNLSTKENRIMYQAKDLPNALEMYVSPVNSSEVFVVSKDAIEILNISTGQSRNIYQYTFSGTPSAVYSANLAKIKAILPNQITIGFTGTEAEKTVSY